MPVAIIIPNNTTPAIIERDTDDALLEAIRELAVTPPEAGASIAAAREWLASLPLPSGWFASVEEAQGLQKRVQLERDAQLIKAVIPHLKTTQRGLTQTIGLADPQKDGSPVRRITRAQQGLSGPSRRALAYALKYGPMTDEDERAILDAVNDGAWRHVDRKSLRRT